MTGERDRRGGKAWRNEQSLEYSYKATILWKENNKESAVLIADREKSFSRGSHFQNLQT